MYIYHEDAGLWECKNDHPDYTSVPGGFGVTQNLAAREYGKNCAEHWRQWWKEKRRKQHAKPLDKGGE